MYNKTKIITDVDDQKWFGKLEAPSNICPIIGDTFECICFGTITMQLGQNMVLADGELSTFLLEGCSFIGNLNNN